MQESQDTPTTPQPGAPAASPEHGTAASSPNFAPPNNAPNFVAPPPSPDGQSPGTSHVHSSQGPHPYSATTSNHAHGMNPGSTPDAGQALENEQSSQSGQPPLAPTHPQQVGYKAPDQGHPIEQPSAHFQSHQHLQTNHPTQAASATPPKTAPNTPKWLGWVLIIMAGLLMLALIGGFIGFRAIFTTPGDQKLDSAKSQDLDLGSYPDFDPIRNEGNGGAEIQLPAGVTAGVIEVTLLDTQPGVSVIDIDISGEGAPSPLPLLDVDTFQTYSAPFGQNPTTYSEPPRLTLKGVGDWTMEIKPMSSLPVLETEASGEAGAVYAYAGEGGTLKIEHGSGFIQQSVTDGAGPTEKLSDSAETTNTELAPGPSIIWLKTTDPWKMQVEE